MTTFNQRTEKASVSMNAREEYPDNVVIQVDGDVDHTDNMDTGRTPIHQSSTHEEESGTHSLDAATSAAGLGQGDDSVAALSGIPLSIPPQEVDTGDGGRSNEDVTDDRSQDDETTGNGNDGIDDDSSAMSRNIEEELERHPSLTALMEVVGTEYSSARIFWTSVLLSSTVLGGILGAVGLAFFYTIKAIEELVWLSTGYEEAMDRVPMLYTPNFNATLTDEKEPPPASINADILDLTRLGTGRWEWLVVMVVGGAIVGAIKTLWNVFAVCHGPCKGSLCSRRDGKRPLFPSRIPGFVEELGHLHASDPLTAVPVFVCATLSVAIGVGVGPEAPMTFIGTVVGDFYAKCLRIRIPFLLERTEFEACVLDGKAAGLSVVFPSQFLSPMMIHEVGKHWGQKGLPGKFDYMETLTRTGVAASVSQFLFLALGGITFLESITFDSTQISSYSSYQYEWIFWAAVLGIFCGILGLFGQLAITLGDICGRRVTRILDEVGYFLLRLKPPSESVESDGQRQVFRLGLLVSPMLGGALVGLLVVLCPLTIGDGSTQFKVVSTGDLEPGVLFCSSIVNFLEISISLGFGFVGGQIFPFLYAGTLFGSAISSVVTTRLPHIMVVASCMVAVPCAFIPGLLSFTVVGSLIFNLNGPQTTPLFVACLFSYATVTGTGLLQKAMTREIAGLERAPLASLRASANQLSSNVRQNQ